MQTDFSSYRKARGVNWSTLTAMQKSPLHYHHRLITPREDTPAMAQGRLIHTAVLEPERLDADYAVWNGRRGTNAYKEWLEGQAGRQIVTVEEYGKALNIADAVWHHPVARQVLAGGKTEQMLTWIDPATRLLCKARPDHIRGRNLADLKSTRDVDAHYFGRTSANLGYHGQMAFYRRAVVACRRVVDPVVRFVVVEQEPPHDVAVYVLSEDVLYVGDQLVQRLLDLVVRYRRFTRPPGAHPTEEPLAFPTWAWPEDMSDEIEVLS